MYELALATINFSSFGLIQWLIIAMVIAGCIGVVYVITKQVGVVIPMFIITIF